jgi:hypothetical protein
MHLASLSLEPHGKAFSTPISFCRKESSLRKKHFDGVVHGKRIPPLLSSRVDFFPQDHQSHHDADVDLVPTCVTYPRISKSTIPREHPGRVYRPWPDTRLLVSEFRVLPSRNLSWDSPQMRWHISSALATRGLGGAMTPYL